MDTRIGRQSPTVSVILPYKDSRAQEAIELYNAAETSARIIRFIILSASYEVLTDRQSSVKVEQTTEYVLRGRAQFPTGGIVREPVFRPIW